VTELRSAAQLSRTDLTQLFTAAYKGYFVPFAVDEVLLAPHCGTRAQPRWSDN
jgi:hypothetical protein